MPIQSNPRPVDARAPARPPRTPPRGGPGRRAGGLPGRPPFTGLLRLMPPEPLWRLVPVLLLILASGWAGVRPALAQEAAGLPVEEALPPEPSATSPAAVPSATLSARGAVGWVTVADAIHPATASFLERSIRWAADERLGALVIELDTPGGLDSSMRQIVQAILGAPLPVILYVSPAGARAASAGVFIMMAAHVAAMAPGTNMGAAHPVSIGGGVMGGGQEPDSTMIAKVTNDAVAYGRSLASNRGRDPDWIEQAVRESSSITAGEALDRGLIDLIAASPEDLLDGVDGRVALVHGVSHRLELAGASIRVREMNLRDRILGMIANPNIAYILLLLGGLGIFFELSHPGTFFPGIVGAVCLLLAFFALQMLPVRAAGIALIGLAIVLFILEIKVTSYGALSIGGVAALVFGSLMLFETNGTGVRLDMDVLIPTVVIVGSLFLGAIWLAVRSQAIQRVTGREGLVGKIGEVRVRLAPRGKVYVHGELWNARAGATIEVGASVRIVRVDGMLLEVEPLANG